MNAVKSLIYRDLCVTRKPVRDTLWFLLAMGAAGLLIILSIRSGNLRPIYEKEENRQSAEFLMVTMECSFTMCISIIFLYISALSDKKWESFLISTPLTADEFAFSKTLLSAVSLVLALPVCVIYAAAMVAVYPYDTMFPHIRLVMLVISVLVMLKCLSDISVKLFRSEMAGYFVMGVTGFITMTVMLGRTILMADAEDADINMVISSLHPEITGVIAPFAAAAVTVITHFILKALYIRRAD